MNTVKKFITIIVIALSATTASATQYLHELAEAIYYESEGESPVCQLLVAETILNRVDLQHFPNTIKEVVHEKRKRKGRWVCQFSYYCDGKPEDMPSHGSAHMAYTIAQMAVANPIRLSKADHYYAHNLVSPDWKDDLEDVTVCDGHTFGTIPVK